jgi:hypothetical protein
VASADTACLNPCHALQINNGDVTNNQNRLSGLFKHDFW